MGRPVLNDPRFLFTRRLPIRLKWLVIGWLAAEFLVFLALVRTIGLGNTILLGLATTVLGIGMVRRIGAEALMGLSRATDGAQAPGALADGMLAGIGAFLLILPGFVANAAGLALAAPSVRRRAMTLFNGDADPGRPPLRRGPTDVIDLSPGEWRSVDRG